MTLGISVRIDITEARRALEQLGEIATGRNLEVALVAGALPIMNAAKANAHVITGTLRRSLHIGGHADLAPGFDPSEGYSDIGGNEVADLTARVFVGTNLVYARREEYGFVGRDSLGRLYNQPPHPYLRPAFDDNEELATREVEDVFALLNARALAGI